MGNVMKKTQISRSEAECTKMPSPGNKGWWFVIFSFENSFTLVNTERTDMETILVTCYIEWCASKMLCNVFVNSTLNVSVWWRCNSCWKFLLLRSTLWQVREVAKADRWTRSFLNVTWAYFSTENWPRRSLSKDRKPSLKSSSKDKRSKQAAKGEVLE